MCVAPTGSGKTLAYVLPTLVRLGVPARSLSSSLSEKGTSSKDSKVDAEEGKGIRALIVVPTHDLAVQIEGVVKAVTRKRGWRVIVLSKATEKAVCDSSPGDGKVIAESDDDEDEAAAESDQDQSEEDEEEAEIGHETDKPSGNGKSNETSRLGIDILISTPERLHHLIQESKLSLSS